MEYSFNLLLAFLFGIFSKAYDDITDNKLNINNFYINFIKYFVITLFSIIFYNSIVFSILFTIICSLSFLMDKFYTSKLINNKDTVQQQEFICMNDDIWLYLLFLAGTFTLYHLYCFLQTNKLNDINLSSIKNITFYINIIIIFFIVTLDIYFTPEHKSNIKLLIRIFVLILLLIYFYCMSFYSEYIYEGNYGIILLLIGYSITSISFLTLDKYKYFDSLKNKSDII